MTFGDLSESCACGRAPVDAYSCTTSRAFEQQLASVFVVLAKVIAVKVLGMHSSLLR